MGQCGDDAEQKEVEKAGLKPRSGPGQRSGACLDVGEAGGGGKRRRGGAEVLEAVCLQDGAVMDSRDRELLGSFSLAGGQSLKWRIIEGGVWEFGLGQGKLKACLQEVYIIVAPSTNIG